MYTSKLLKRCFIPTLAATAVEVNSKNTSEEKEECLIRPSELPLYKREPPSILAPPKEQNPQLAKISEFIGSLRIQLFKFTHECSQYKKVGLQEINKRKDDMDWLVRYLQEENNTLPKIGAIGIGGLTGLIFGLRGGLIKKTIYSTIGALGIASVCYPKEASEYGQIGLTEGKKYAMVSYNFITGAKKEDPPKEFPTLPQLPSSLSEVWESMKSTASSFMPSDTPKSNVANVEKVTENLTATLPISDQDPPYPPPPPIHLERPLSDPNTLYSFHKYPSE
ncbi:unnamed protein product [Phyllotreta striolata]|uniref:MICOS complex subunit n=1 Tax=Phyllotreta striolata TaxID=444603 RepID=A0A9N9XQR1_PHYSR|nr:unnamed protein product [Phyllotreta striolata]